MSLELTATDYLTAATDGRVALDAALLKHLRKARGLSQEALAELCFQRQLPVSIASIKRAETGKAVLYRTARHLATIFGVEPDTLITQVQDADPIRTPAAQLPAMTTSAPAGVVRYLIQMQIVFDGAVMADSESATAAVVARFGGAAVTAGSARVLATFGHERTFGSDVERSLQCALELRHTLRAHGLRAIAMRLARGTGDVPAAGLRLSGAIGSDAVPVYLARDLAGQLSDRFDFGAEHAPPGYLAFAGSAGSCGGPALVGRVAERRQFAAVAGAVQEAGSGHIVYLRAMAGVGKSRLAADFADSARTLAFSCYRCQVADAGAPDWRAPLGQLARQLLGAGADSEAALDDAIEGAVASLRLGPEASLFLRALTGARMTSGQMSIHAAMSHAVRDQGSAGTLLLLLTRMGALSPLLLTVEDVHWAAPHLFQALGALMAGTHDLPVIWVLSSRIEHDPLESLLRPHLFELALTVFDLAPLGPREAQALADQFGAVDPVYRARCIERAQGNPLFLTQLLASPEHHLPDSLKLTIQARLDALAPRQQRALRTAAVIGNRFELSLLREALGEPDYEPDDGGRNSLVRRVGVDTVAFVHDLVMHCIYDAIDPAQQRRLHRELAALYRERDPVLAAQHMYRADDPAAFDMMLRAIRDKLAAYQFEAALELSAECSANDSTRYSSFTLALLKAHATAGLGSMAEARLAYQHALMLAGRPTEKIDAVIGLAATLNVLDQLDEEEHLIDETLPLARSIDADASLARLFYLKGNIYFPRGNYSECRRLHDAAVSHARTAGATETEARALSGLGDSWYAQGRMKTAREVFARCIAMCEEHRYAGIEASNRAALGSTRIYLGEPGLALDDALHSAQLAHTVGNRRAEVFSRMTAAWVLVATGQTGRADGECAQALALARGIGATRFEPLLLESQARSAWQRGEHALARACINDAAAIVRRLQLQRFCGPWVLGTLALFTDDEHVRKKSLLQGAAWLTGDCLAHNAYRFFVSAAEVSLLEGDMVAAEFYTGQLAALGEAEPSAWVDHHVALFGGQAASAAATLGFAFTTPRLAR